MFSPKDDRIPVKIEIIGSELKKSIVWTATGTAIGSLLAGPIGAVIGGLTQGNGQKVSLKIVFEDRSEKIIECDGQKLKYELFVWAWRIQNIKSERDYVDFGLDFTTLQRNQIVSTKRVGEALNFDPEGKSLKELWGNVRLEMELHKLFKREIERYFWEERKERILLENDTRGLKIPPKFDLITICTFGFIFLVMATGIVQNCTKQPGTEPNYRPAGSEHR
jgi:hypothetical protein